MNRKKILLFALAALLLIPAFVLGTTDILSGDQNCVAALFPKDTEQLVQQSGDPIEDDVVAEMTREKCDREILRQRVLMGFVLLLAVCVFITATRVTDQVERFPGDPIV